MTEVDWNVLFHPERLVLDKITGSYLLIKFHHNLAMVGAASWSRESSNSEVRWPDFSCGWYKKRIQTFRFLILFPLWMFCGNWGRDLWFSKVAYKHYMPSSSLKAHHKLQLAPCLPSDFKEIDICAYLLSCQGKIITTPMSKANSQAKLV